MENIEKYMQYIISFFTQLFHNMQETFANLFVTAE